MTIFDALIFADLVNILTPLQCIFLALEPSPVYSRDGIKGLILRHFSKLKSTHPGKLRQPQIMHCGSRRSCIAAAAMHDIPSLVLLLVHCGNATFKFGCRNARAAIHEMELHSTSWIAADCGSAAVGVDVPQ